jgi:ATP/maltotriose-dependent transcriptional regulator MalT
MSLFGLSLAHTRRGDEALARDYGEEGLAISRALDDRWFTPYFLWVLAVNELAAHHLDRAEPLAAESLSMGRELGAPLILVCALDVMAACAARRGDDDEALALLLEAEELGASGEVPGSYVSSALTSLGELRRSRAEWDAAREVLGRSLEIARGVGDPWAEQRALEAQARLTAG